LCGALAVSVVDELLASYPRQRPPLPPAQRAIYVAEYRDNRTGANPVQRAAQWAESWMHRQVAAIAHPGPVLEIGAGALNHLPYEASPDYDVVEPFVELYHDIPLRGRVRRFYRDITELPRGSRYQRILSVAVLEHLEDLPLNIALSGLLLAPGGRFQAGIPSEGGLLWGLGWRCTTGLSYRLRTGHSYGTLMRYEHINTAPEIIAVVRHFFPDLAVRRFPLPAHHLSLYAYLQAERPDPGRCRACLAERGPD